MHPYNVYAWITDSVTYSLWIKKEKGRYSNVPQHLIGNERVNKGGRERGQQNLHSFHRKRLPVSALINCSSFIYRQSVREQKSIYLPIVQCSVCVSSSKRGNNTKRRQWKATFTPSPKYI